MLLDIPHYDQNDNDTHLHGPGYRQCFKTSVAMMLEGVLNGGLSHLAKRNNMAEPESYYGYHLAEYGDTTKAGPHINCLREVFKVDASFIQNASLQDIKDQLALGYGVPVGLHYKSSGHWVCVVGWDEESKVFTVNDPYGIREGSSNRYKVIGNYSGRHDTYSEPLMLKLFSGSCDNDGWMIQVKGMLDG